ncbi:Rsp5p-dependent ubiquitination, sorting of cargo proteins at the multivesicular body, partial [Mortierella sp. GBA30]
MFEKSPNTTIAIGVSTKPYPSTRLPGWNRHSVGYFSNNGKKFCNSPWNAHHYGPPFHEADVVGCGYRPRNGTIFFTRNGKRIEDAYTGFGRTNLFPTVGATGPCVLHVNFGQSGFVFVEANVKKWGLAPASGSLAPPPAYGSEVGSILLEASGSATEAQGALSYMRGSTARGQARPILQSSASRTTIQGMPRQGQRGELRNNRTPGDVEHGVSATAPMEISLSNTSAPPPKYSSLDCNGNPSGNYGQGTRSDNLDGRQHADQHDVGGGADTEDEDEDAASVQSDSSDES